MLNQLDKIEKRFIELEEEIARPGVAGDIARLQKLARERAGIEDVVTSNRQYKETARSLEETKKMLSAPVVHKPVKDGECLPCHNPHGGTNKRFLRGKSMKDMGI